MQILWEGKLVVSFLYSPKLIPFYHEPASLSIKRNQSSID